MQGKRRTASQNWDFDCVRLPHETIFEKLGTSYNGLTDQEANNRLQEYGFNEPVKEKKEEPFLF